MVVRIDNAMPMLKAVALLGSSALRVYAVMWEAAGNDNRGDRGGTTSYTIKGLSIETGLKRDTVARALNKLLLGDFLQIEHEEPNTGGSNNTVWHVTHPKMLEAVRYSIDVMGHPATG